MMDTRNYWLDLFTWTTWQAFLEAGAKVSGFRERRWKTVQKINPGDYLLCYLTGVSRFIGILEVTSSAYKDNTQIWKDEVFPCRLKVKLIAKLEPDTAVPVVLLKDQLTVFQDLKHPNAWTGHFRGSPARWKATDGEAVVNAVRSAEKNPIVRPIDKAKLSYRPKAIKAKIGMVTVPGKEEPIMEAPEMKEEISSHTEIQWLLLKLGSDMGLDVWVARNDRGREVNGQKFIDLPRMREELPLQFDEATTRTIEHIDVLWIKGNAIVAAFEIESTTLIYSGLLRLADLIAMQPNLNVPLFLVAPDERRDKVMSEVNRPTFSRLSPPMSQMCRFIPFSLLRMTVSQVAPMVQYLKPELLEGVSESCEIEEL